jgi:hypothetical protein
VKDSEVREQFSSSGAEPSAGGGPQSKPSGGGKESSKGFIVRDAPWSQSYTHNADDFPNLAASTAPANGSATARPVWPVAKR